MLNIAKIDVGHANYYAPRNGEGRESASLYGSGGSGGSGGGSVDGAARYYADGAEGKGVWVAGGGMSVEVGAVVDNAQLTAMLAGYDPTTGVRLGRKYQAGGTFVDRMGITRQRKSVCAYDSTFSVPKSVSGAWALADDETRCEIEQAFDAAVTAVIDYLQLNAISSRRSGANGLEEVSCSRGATVARFTHTTSRAGDPQLHAHVLWANKVLCDDGKWRTLDGSKLYANAKAASMVGAAVLRGEISQRLGWSWDKSNDSGHCEIAGFPTVLAELWSQRRRAVERVAAKKVREFESNRGREPTVEERIMIWQQAAEQTRAKKNELPSGDLFEQWKQQANSIGIDPTSVISSLRAADRAVPGVYDAPEQLIDTPLSDTGSSHVIATVEQYATGLTRQQLDEVIYRAISATGQARRVANSGVAAVHQRAELLLEQVRSAFVEVEGRWWSPGMMAAEASVFDWFDLRHSTPLANVAVDVDGLSDSQTAAVRLLAESTSNGSILIGPAGTGKTVALRPLCEAVGLEKVVAAAPTAVAAGSLGSSLRIRGETVAKLITSAAELPANGLVIVDEAGQLSTRDMAVLIGKADRVGARVLLVGDPAQQSSVAAGGLFDGLAHSQTGTIAALTELKRFIDPAEAAVTVQLRNGEIKALNFYADAGRSADCAAAEVAETAADWWFEHHDKSSVIAAPTRNITHEINIEIAARRAANGETGEPVAGAGESIMRLGDVITTRCNNRKIVSSNGEFVRNGDRWIIKGATKTGGLVAVP